MKEYSLGTKCVQGGYTPGNGEPRQIPIVQSTTFKYETSEAMGRLFDLEEEGYFYSRLQNPTNDTVARKICELEGGSAAMLTSSGKTCSRCTGRWSGWPHGCRRRCDRGNSNPRSRSGGRTG